MRLLVMVAFLAASSPAFAQSDEAKAIAEIERAVELYKQGQFRDAGDGFLRAYSWVRRPVQLRNAAKSYEQASMYEEALRIWEQFRDHSGVSDEDVREARAHIEMIGSKQREQAALRAAEAAKADAARARAEADALRAQAEVDARARREADERANALPVKPEVKAPPPPVEMTPPLTTTEKVLPPPRSPPILGMGLIAAGVGLGVASAILFALARSEGADTREQAQAEVDRGRSVAAAEAEFAEQHAAVEGQLTFSLVMAIAGAASIGGGLYFLLRDDSSSLDVAPAPGGAKVIWTARW